MKKYIVIEGIHGAGKSSIAKEVTKKLQKKGFSAEYYHFPDENDDLGKVIRKTVADKELVYQREITGLLYASFANIFHTKTKNTDKIYILDRHSVTTGLVFQQQMSRSTRLEIYKPGIKALLENGQIFYLKIDKKIARKRSEERNREILEKELKKGETSQTSPPTPLLKGEGSGTGVVEMDNNPSENNVSDNNLSNNVRVNKAKDVFNEDKFDELTELYENSLIPQIEKLGLECEVVDNNGSMENTVDEIAKMIEET